MIANIKATVNAELIEIKVEGPNTQLVTSIKNTVTNVLLTQGAVLTELKVTVT